MKFKSEYFEPKKYDVILDTEQVDLINLYISEVINHEYVECVSVYAYYSKSGTPIIVVDVIVDDQVNGDTIDEKNKIKSEIKKTNERYSYPGIEFAVLFERDFSKLLATYENKVAFRELQAGTIIYDKFSQYKRTRQWSLTDERAQMIIRPYVNILKIANINEINFIIFVDKTKKKV